MSIVYKRALFLFIFNKVLHYIQFVSTISLLNRNTKKAEIMYTPNITKNSDGSFYALVIRIDNDGERNVVHGFSRHFKTEKRASKSANAFIAKLNAY